MPFNANSMPMPMPFNGMFSTPCARMRSNRPSAVAARRKSHARFTRAPFFGVRVERATRAICDALRPRTVSLTAPFA
eukprot:2827584-Lingulodinium_polyedra.AAC.1